MLFNYRDSCPKCGGNMFGNGYTEVIHCEFAEESTYEYLAPDSNPVLCNYEETEETPS